MADLPVDATALGLNGVAATFDGHPEPGRRFIVQGMPTGFFYRSKRLDWRGLKAQGIPVAFRGRTREDSGGQNGRRHERRSGRWNKFGQKFARLKKIKDRIVKEVLKTMRTHLC
ncbi:hypothetical protein [Paraburkholderia sp. BL25I1N1]|uniref:hypothetical protein n=1 Tax=Paraburkholderia sp. BL25I1N1 TaxID=1938804 RepID=UPI000D4BB8AF|nr:hypothetical protein [Paraburkholderia sp. BL25I1N1]PRY00334.1 hypothetical protein B0G73_121113 [Paraburkholderia sp. BL25I1N1]